MIRALGMASAMIVPMRVRDRVLGAISFVSAESGRTLHPGRPAARRGPGAARGDRGRERAPLPRALDDRADAAGVAAAADAARRARRRRGRALPRRGRGPRGRRRLLRPLRDQRGPLVRGHRRRLRQGRRGGGRDRARPLHDPRGGGAAALPGRDPALGQRGDAARGLDALLHGRDRPPRPLGRRRAPDHRGRRAPGPDRGAGRRPRRGAPRGGHAARARRRPGAQRHHDGRSRRATRSCSTPTASPRPRRRTACGRRRTWPRSRPAPRARTAQSLVDHVAEAALSGLSAPPRDDVAMLALRLEPS